MKGSGRNEHTLTAQHPRPKTEAAQSKVSPNPKTARAMDANPSLLTRAPLEVKGGYSPMTGAIVPGVWDDFLLTDFHHDP